MMNNTSNNGMPIRLLSDGHTLSNGCTAQYSTNTEVLLCTPKTTLVPCEQLSSDVATHLRNVGLSPTTTECVVVSPERGGIVAVMAIERRHYEEIMSSKSEVRFTSPLLDDDISEKGCTISLYGNVLYVRIVENGLRFAEAMEIRTNSDILFYVERINSVYGICNMYARASGNKERLSQLLKKKFKNLICE